MADMLVKLFHLQQDPAAEAALLQNGVRLCRALPPDRDRVIGFCAGKFPRICRGSRLRFIPPASALLAGG